MSTIRRSVLEGVGPLPSLEEKTLRSLLEEGGALASQAEDASNQTKLRDLQICLANLR